MFASPKDHLESAMSCSLTLEAIRKVENFYLTAFLIFCFTGFSVLNAKAVLVTMIIYATMVGWLYARIHIALVVVDLIIELKKIVDEERVILTKLLFYQII